MTELGQFGLFLSIGATALALLVGPVGAALARRLGGPAEPDTAELEELRERLSRLEAQQDRLSDVESRLDFTERVLAQQEPDRLKS